MDQAPSGHLSPRTLVFAFAATAVALPVLALADSVTPYGWKVFVLTKLFKISWAATAALVGAFSVATVIRAFVTRIPSDVGPATPPSCVTAIAAFAAALILLGYLMPDWNPWSEGIAALFLLGWALIALAIRVSSR